MNLQVHKVIGHYNPSVRIMTLVLTPLMLCALILYMTGGTYSLKSTPNDKAFHGNFIYSREFLPEICKEEVAEEIFLF